MVFTLFNFCFIFCTILASTAIFVEHCYSFATNITAASGNCTENSQCPDGMCCSSWGFCWVGTRYCRNDSSSISTTNSSPVTSSPGTKIARTTTKQAMTTEAPVVNLTTTSSPTTTSSRKANLIPWNEVQSPADFTYYNDLGHGACGDTVNAAAEDLVAVSYEWFTTSDNPNYDQLCNNVCVNVTYKGNSVKVPVKDKCPSCKKLHLDLSQPAFSRLPNIDIGHVYNAEWFFVPCS